MAIAGIIFDMDNTLLRSRIDYAAMKRDTLRYLLDQGVPPKRDADRHTTSTLINEAIRSGMLTDEQTAELWNIARRHELAGMQGAGLEPGAGDVLRALERQAVLAVVTNNAYDAAAYALERNGIMHCFRVIVAREHMNEMKPAPDGFLRVLESVPEIPARSWVSVGDSWIDGHASAQAGIPFVAYQADEQSLLSRGVRPETQLSRLDQLLDWLNSRSDFGRGERG